MADERDPLTHMIIGAAMEVHKELGPGLLESVYQKCFEKELTLQDVFFQAQARLPLVYKGEAFDAEDLKMDLYFPQKLVVEIEAVEHILPVRQAQLITYLRLSKTRVGLLINFNVSVLKEGIKRLVV